MPPGECCRAREAQPSETHTNWIGRTERNRLLCPTHIESAAYYTGKGEKHKGKASHLRLYLL